MKTKTIANITFLILLIPGVDAMALDSDPDGAVPLIPPSAAHSDVKHQRSGRGRSVQSAEASDNALKVRPSLPKSKDISYVDAQKYISGFTVKFNSDQNQIELSGLVPNTCKAALGVNGYRAQNSNSLKFEVVDRTGSGLACLKKNAQVCSESSSQCTTFKSLFADKTLKSHYKTIVGLDELQPGTLSIGYTYYVDGKWQTPTNESADDDLFAIDSCGCKRLETPPPMTDAQVKNVKDILDVTVASSRRPPSPVADAAEMQEHLKRVKERMLKKISSSPCSRQGEEGEDGDALESQEVMFSMDEGGDGEGGRGARMVGGMVQSDVKMDLALQDDIQDAIDKKVERCARKRASTSIGGSAQAGGAVAQISGVNQIGYGTSAPVFGSMNIGQTPMGFGNQVANQYGAGLPGYGATSTLPFMMQTNPLMLNPAPNYAGGGYQGNGGYSAVGPQTSPFAAGSVSQTSPFLSSAVSTTTSPFNYGSAYGAYSGVGYPTAYAGYSGQTSQVSPFGTTNGQSPFANSYSLMYQRPYYPQSATSAITSALTNSLGILGTYSH